MSAERSVEKKDRSLAASAPVYKSIDAYYRAEEKSLHKNEYHDGVIIHMAGAKLIHNLLAQKASTLIGIFLLEKNLDYLVSNSDTKIRIEAFNKIVYPDAVVICSAPQYFDGREDTITNPLLVVEVLSKSTQRHDRTTKFELYRSLESFKEYVLIYQDLRRVAVWSKQADGSWFPQDYVGEEAVAVLHAIENCPLDLARLYKGI